MAMATHLLLKLSNETTETVKITIQESKAGAEVFLCLIKHHTTKTYGGEDEYFPTFQFLSWR
jgi:hypothetical protein